MVNKMSYHMHTTKTFHKNLIASSWWFTVIPFNISLFIYLVN